jgi:nucleotide-binding universal stress UspA family protein
MTTKPNSLLVAVDFNDQSMVAMRQSFNMARLLNNEIILLYVLEQADISNTLFSREQDVGILSTINGKLENTAAEISSTHGLKTTPLLRKGKVHSTILRTAADYNSRFIFMGTNDTAKAGLLEKNLLGSNTSKVIRQSKVPVISINGEHHYDGCRSILLPLDLTKETRQKVTHAIEMARLFDATIKVMSVLWDKNDKEASMQLERQMAQVKKFIADASIKIHAEILSVEGGQRELVPTIFDYADKQGDVDLIMIMTQQENRLVEFFIGSAAQQIIRQSKIPVMSIIPKELGFSYYQF